MNNKSIKTMFSAMSDSEIYLITRLFGLGGCNTTTLEKIGKKLSIPKGQILKFGETTISKAHKIALRNKFDLCYYLNLKWSRK